MWSPLRANQNISRRAGEDTRPYGGNRSGDVGLANPGAGMEPQQRQFLQTQGPVARREFRHPLRFCAPEGFCLLQGVTPVNRGPGADSPCQGEMSRSDKGDRVGEYGHGVSILSRPPSGSLVTFWPSRKSLAARRRRNPPCKKRNRSVIAPSSVTASPCHLPPRGKA